MQNSPKEHIHINSALYIDDAGDKGRGVFTKFDLNPMFVIEISSVLVMSAEERKLLDATALYNYIFEWGANNDQCCAAWGYISMYNHSYNSNCEYFMDSNGDFNDTTPLWFDAI